jgi:hydroxymethylpyrimidine/phosphomethylpyrimidine kinase
MITGIVKNIECSYASQNEDGWFSFFEAQIEIFGTILTAVFKDKNLTGVKTGNIITSAYYLMGDLPGKEL